MIITKETKWHLSCHCHVNNNYAADPALITTKIPRFHLTQGSSTPNNLMGRVKTMWEPCLFRGRPPVPLKKVANRDIWFFIERDWSQGYCHGNNIVGVICFFEDHWSNISGDILNSVFYHFSGTIDNVNTSFICILQKREYISKMKKDIPKRKTPFFFTLKSLSNSSYYFLLHRHFKFISIKIKILPWPDVLGSSHNVIDFGWWFDHTTAFHCISNKLLRKYMTGL